MLVSRARKTPSVVSTRVLKTHRMNLVEIFRLQERVKTIDYESQHSYSQISDEIDGVRQNLVKIKGVKKNVGVSVERRKLLRDKGLRILPCKDKSDAEHFTVRSSCGKDINILCSDFYDGGTLRKQLSIEKFKTLAAPNLDAENSDNEELIDRSSTETQGRSKSLWKDFRYRTITPPLRPGSRRNFRDVEDENCKDKEKLISLDEIGNIERKYGILRLQTAHLKRDKEMVLRPSRTCPGYIQENRGSTPRRKIFHKSYLVTGNVRKKSRDSDSVTCEKKTDEKSAELQLESGPGIEPNFLSEESKDKDVLEETIPLDLKPPLRPKIRPRSMTVASLAEKKRISDTVAELRRMSLENSASSDRLPPAPSNGNWCHSKSPETSPRVPKNSVTTANHDVKEDNYEPDGDQRRLSKLSEKKISRKDSVYDAGDKGDDKITRGKLSDAFLPSKTVLRKPKTNGVQSTATHVQSAPQGRPGLSRQQNSTLKKVSKINGRRNSAGDFVYDARPDKALSKGYSTMQMTIGGKQVRVYVPKFSTSDCIGNITPAERTRAIAVLQAAGGPGKKLLAKNK